MRYSRALIIASLLSILLTTLHLADDVARGMELAARATFIAVPVLAVWLYGTLVLTERRSGYVIMLLGSLLGLVIPFVHMKGAGVDTLARSSGGFLFIWTLMALALTALFSTALSIRGLWEHRHGPTHA